jgi:hypothetical protein
LAWEGSGMKKLLGTLVILVLVIAAVAWYFVSFRLDGLIERVIEESGTSALGTSVQVGKVTTSIREGSLEISSLSVANPPGYSRANAISFDGIEASVDYEGFIIDRVIIDKPSVVIEEKGGKSNFGDLLAGMESGQSEPSPADETEQPTITIRQFRMNATSASFVSEALGADSELHVDAIMLNNIQGTPDEVALVIARRIVTDLSKVAATEILKAQAKKKLGLDPNEDDLKKSIGDRVKDLLGKDDDDSGG